MKFGLKLLLDTHALIWWLKDNEALKGFNTPDTVAHVLTALQILELALMHVVGRAEVPNPNWLVPGIPSAGQQALGDQLLSDHLFVAIPSTESKHN